MLGAGAVLAAVSVSVSVHAQRPLPPTPAQTEGPFYPRTLPADHDADLTQVAGHPVPAEGTRLYLTGRVLARDGRPQAGATVELWQCDVYGRYHHVGEPGSPRDDGFQGYGATVTDAQGRYAFKTIRPVGYSGRVPHLHLKVRTAAGVGLTTQGYIEGDRTDGDPVLASSTEGTRELLTVAIAPAAGREPGAIAGTFDLVLP
jgi:protocatechuate 3,4-dioxygenase, beta subunit